MIVGFLLLRGEHFEVVLAAVRARATARPSHDELAMELVELGEWLGFVVSREEHTPDGLYRLDVVWRDEEGHAPLKAFEVELGGEVDKALASLAHAYDMWRCEQLWLIVSDKAKAERALKLVEPRLRGSFARIRSRLVVLGWEELHSLYTTLKQHAELLKKLAKEVNTSELR